MPPYRENIFNDMKKKSHIICDNRKILLGDITSSNVTLWDRLYKASAGLKVDKSKKLLDYLDDKMTRKFGEDKSLWTAKMARQVREELLEELYDLIGERPGEEDSSEVSDSD